MRTQLLILIAAVGLVALEKADGQAAAQQAPAPANQASSASASSSADGHRLDVVITAQREELATRISAFVNQVTDFDLGDPGRGLARWQEPVCPLVTGLPRKEGEYILARVSQIAQAAGAPLGDRWCRPNLFIVVSNHSQAVLQDLEKRHRSAVFGDAPPDIIDEFMATPRPVKTWYDTVARTPEGLPLLNMSFPGISQQNRIVTPQGNVVTVPIRPSNPYSPGGTNPWAQASRLTLNVVWAIYHAFVVVDPTQFKGVTLGQLADYVAMAGLAQVKTDARLGGAPTILTLFDGAPQAASAGMTDWDRAFLKSFYSTEQKSALQRGEIALDMAREITP